MYQPEFIARRPASRTSSFTKTFDSGIFFISLTLDSVDVDPFSGARRFQRGLNHANCVHSVRAIHQRPIARFDRLEKRRQLRAQRFVIHLAGASEKVSHDGVNAARRSAEEKLKQIDKMDAVGKSHTRVLPRAFETAEVCS